MSETEKIKWYYLPWVVLLLLFVVLGPFGLPFLYKSPAFGKTSKIVLTLLVILFTGYLVIMSWIFIEKWLAAINNLNF